MSPWGEPRRWENLLLSHTVKPVGCLTTGQLQRLASFHTSRIIVLPAIHDSSSRQAALRGSYIVRPVAVDIVRTAFESEGKGEKFDEKDIPFLSGEQFAWGTGFAGILLSERPASTIITGASGADVMMHAEISNQIGALTITSGSYIANVTVMACASDYIMIGEEVPAAGAYLSQAPAQLASIKTQDLYKFIAIGSLIIGWVLSQAGIKFVTQLLTS